MVATLIIEGIVVFVVVVLTRLFYFLFGIAEIPMGTGLMVFLSAVLSVITVAFFVLLARLKRFKKYFT